MQARVATALQARSVIMLQLVSRQCCGTVAARVAGALRRCCSIRHGNAAVARIATALLQQVLRQRCGATALLQLAAMTESSALCNDGKWL